MTGFFCSVEPVGRMFLGFLCTVKTLRSLLFGQNSRQDLPSQFRLILGEAGGYKTSKWLISLYILLCMKAEEFKRIIALLLTL